MATEYLTYPSTPEFNETPDGIITTFTFDPPCVENTIVLIHGGMRWKDFTYTDTQTLELDVAPPSGTELYISSGFFGTAAEIVSDYTSFLTRLRLLIQDNLGVITDAELLLCLVDAVHEYSKVRPQAEVADVTGVDSYELDLPSGWDTDISRISSIEGILDVDGEETIYVLDPTTYELYLAPDRSVIRSSIRFSTQYTYRVRYTEAQIFSPELVTVPTNDQRPILFYGAHQACLIMAAYANQNVEHTLGAATVGGPRGNKTEAQIWMELAGKYLEQWRTSMNLPKTGIKNPVAVTSFNWKRDNTNMLFH